MVTTISVTEGVKKELVRLKIELGYSSIDSLIKDAIAEIRNNRFGDASRLFRQKLKEKGLTVSDIQRQGAQIRKEIFGERFQK